MKKFTAIDAFCGAGGLSLGLKNAGFEILFSFDSDPLCIETLKENKKYHDHKCYSLDVKDSLNDRVLKIVNLKRGDLDLLAGGPPCQGFSIQRTVGGDFDDRNLLVDDYGDLIIEVYPKFFLLENVTGIGGKRGREILEKFKKRMESHDYICHERILDAKDYGVPQRRKRYILVGERTSSDSHFCWPKANQIKVKTVRDAIAHLPPIPSDGKPHPDIPMHRADKLSDKNLERIRAISSGQAREHLPNELLAECHKLSADKIGHRNVYGRMEWDLVAPTITAKFDSFTRGKFGHPVQDRSISLLEGALLQTFPEDYVFLGNKIQAARQIGNAVPPLLAEVIGKEIIRALKNEF
ncbi:DNA (cytosine-5)-methyltransferase 1 [Shewanella chilikensis]|uniref:Cytosine-specific methyltransferase n=1 Tax=Shewanella chilikensis TaxID=558541 RepID=A0ABX5PR13_9GAMM|nr:DNA cytosine methyltransferase [Shewanella chilikensis]MCL1153967.1 DNA cytosine methyltransferase [Shewanella chilikensis]PYE59930.1 DNA (cytosine-5)-methyltransferase 1 [Shewanella chilikensis]GGZ19841.1 cytosine-specific methyltransferase [Shewanella chilikensis]